MRKLVVDQNKVTKEIAEQLVKACPFNAIEYKDNKIDINMSCKTCGMCVRKFPNGPISIVEANDGPSIDKSKYKGIAVFVELNNEGVHPVVFELIGKARDLAKTINHPIYAVLIASQEESNNYSSLILSYGVDTLYIYEHKTFKDFNIESFAVCFEDFVDKVKPSSILIGGTPLGRSFAPKIAAHYRTGLTADCIKLGIKENTDLIQIRPAFGGNVMAQIITTNNRPQMATVRPKIFKMPNKETPHGSIIKMDVSLLNLTSHIKLLSKEIKQKSLDISKAEVIVAIGRAFKKQEDINKAKELAALLNGVIACSRPLVEDGIMDGSYQIGLSGKTVTPKVIFVLGVSGSVQFTSGMKNSELIIAVNIDKHAKIFDIAHYSIVMDAFKFIDNLIKALKKEKTNV